MLVDPQWQSAAKANSQNGYPFAVWGKRGELPAVLLDSKRTKESAESFADSERSALRPKGQWIVFICEE